MFELCSPCEKQKTKGVGFFSIYTDPQWVLGVSIGPDLRKMAASYLIYILLR